MEKSPKEVDIALKQLTKAKSNKKRDIIRSLQTYFRNSYRVHTALSALADRKSNIMIKLNSIIISIIIVFFKFITEFNPAAFVAIIVFLITTLLSLVFATLAARPKISNVTKYDQSPDHVKRNFFFFGNYAHLDKDQYDESFKALMKDKRLIYDNMVNDLYYLGKVLDRKFRFINWSYNIFLVGLVLTVITFLIELYIGHLTS